ncbi:MAG: hypothetical protein QXV53_05810, partial [Zestosphaera sp.]
MLAAATLAATHYGGGFVLGGASWGATYGLGGFWYGAACGLGLALLGITFAKLSRALALYTVPELLRMRYRGYSVQAISALLSLLALVGIIGAQVWAAGAVFEAMGLHDYSWRVLTGGRIDCAGNHRVTDLLLRPLYFRS